MAEFFLPVISDVVQKLSNLFVREASSLSTMQEDVRRMREDLRLLQRFLKEADRKKESDDRLCDLVDQVRDLAYDLEDAIAIYDNLQATSSCKKASRLLGFRSHINSMRNRTSDIKNSMLIYGGVKLDGGSEGPSSVVELMHNLRRTYPEDDDEEEDDVITMEDSFNALKRELMKEEDRLRIVSVVGMGGLGKTTLAKQVYNSSNVQQHFDCCAWVFISQQYISNEILIEILTQVGSGYEEKIARKKNNVRQNLEEKTKRREFLKTLKQHELMDLLKDNLKEKTYLVVLDDIWKTEAWDVIKKAFPKGKKGSKVVFTTRIKQVALTADPDSSPIEPSLLSLEESWKLLKRKAFRRSIDMEPGDLLKFEEVGKEIVKRCGGLPLAVVVLGGLLRTKASLDEWAAVQGDVISHLNKLQPHEKEYEGVRAMLGLSYVDLPYHLKQCFLYLGNFPEDSEINKRQLVRLWIAEGFIPKPETMGLRVPTEQTWEDIAERYLQELVDRCMVQVAKRDHTGKGVKTCRMHDLMRDCCVVKAREEKFLDTIFQLDNVNMAKGSTTCHGRRVAVHHWEGEQVPMHPHLRSMLFFPPTYYFYPSTLPIKSYKFLRVLNIQFSTDGYDDFKVLRNIGNLVHLRYLGLRRFYKLKLPNSMGNLLNLHTLDLHDNYVIFNLRVITKLTHLRHLLLPRYLRRKSSYDVRLHELKEIETLRWIPPNYFSLNELTNLRNLKIICNIPSRDYLETIIESPVIKSGRLRSLTIDAYVVREFPLLDSLTYCHHLSKMTLVGRIRERNHNLLFLPQTRLTKLTLEEFEINQDPMQVLEKLPNLRHLNLSYYSYIGSQMVCSAPGFPMLETLAFKSLNQLEEWQVEEGAMPSLKSLCIHDVRNLRCLPEGLRYVTTLQRLDVIGMPNLFTDRLKLVDGSPGPDFDIVRHVTSLKVSN